MKNTFNSRKNWKILSSDAVNTFYCSHVYNLAQKLSKLLVTHYGGKLSRVGELSLAERLQRR